MNRVSAYCFIMSTIWLGLSFKCGLDAKTARTRFFIVTYAIISAAAAAAAVIFLSRGFECLHK